MLEGGIEIVVTPGWPGVLTAIATICAVVVALGLHFHRQFQERRNAREQDDKKAIIALQVIYSELRDLDEYFGIVKLNLDDLHSEAAVVILMRIADLENKMDPGLPVVMAENRIDLIARLPPSLAGAYSNALTRYRIVKENAKRLVEHYNGNEEGIVEGQRKGSKADNFFRIAMRIKKAANEGEGYTGYLLKEAEERDPDLKPVRVAVKDIFEEASRAESDTS